MPLHLEMVTKMATMYKVAQSHNPKTPFFFLFLLLKVLQKTFDTFPFFLSLNIFNL